MITKNDDLLGTLIHDVAHLLRHDIDRRLEPHNLTRVKWLALGVLARNGALTQAELAQKMELGNATVGRLVDRLEDRGFVARAPDENDRRSYQVSVTQSAKDLLKNLDATGAEFRKDTLESLSDAEIIGLNKGLLKLKENLKTKAATACALLCLSLGKIASDGEMIGAYAAII